MTLRQTGFTERGLRDAVKQGWATCFDTLTE